MTSMSCLEFILTTLIKCCITGSLIPTITGIAGKAKNNAFFANLPLSDSENDFKMEESLTI